MVNRIIKLLILAAAVIASQTAFGQDEITLIAPGGIRAAVEQLIPRFEQETGLKVKAEFASGGVTRQRVAHGDPFDVPIVQTPYPEVLASGNVVNSSAKPLANVSLGVAVRKGARKPDISNREAVRQTLLTAESISVPDAAAGAAAGVRFNEMLQSLGIAQQVEPKVKRAQGGAGAMAMVAKGEAVIGLTFVSEMEDPGIDVAGSIPPQVSPPVELVGFISTHAKDQKKAKALLDYLASPRAAAAYEAQHMKPGR